MHGAAPPGHGNRLGAFSERPATEAAPSLDLPDDRFDDLFATPVEGSRGQRGLFLAHLAFRKLSRTGGAESWSNLTLPPWLGNCWRYSRMAHFANRYRSRRIPRVYIRRWCVEVEQCYIANPRGACGTRDDSSGPAAPYPATLVLDTEPGKMTQRKARTEVEPCAGS